MTNIRFLILFIGLGLLFSCTQKKPTPPINLQEPFYLEDGSIGIRNAQDIGTLRKAYSIAKTTNNDSLQSKMMLEVAYRYSKTGDSVKFIKSNRQARKLLYKVEDSSGVAASYWDLANFYDAHQIKDSAYYYYHQGQKLYKRLDNEFNAARLLLNMAIIQKDIKDYTGSEITTVKAINIFKDLRKDRQLYTAYNNLGIIYNELEEYEKALVYYKEAIVYLKKANNTYFFPSVFNNIGVVFNNKEDYEQAANYYSKALNYRDDLENSEPELYAILLDNSAYNRFKSGDTTDVIRNLKESLDIRKQLDISPGIVINHLHLAEYFVAQGDTAKALKHAREANALSLSTNNNRDLLASLKLLSSLEREKAFAYSQQYIKINDSLQKSERSIRNKFARIRFETNEFISKTQRLSQRIIIISVIATSLVLIFILLYIINNQKSKNRLIRQKQIANQEIYDLVLAQQKKFEEGREKEKQHISRELHDGILSRLFAVRLNLDALNEKESEEGKKQRLKYIGEIQKIAEEVRFVSHRLSKSTFIDVNLRTVLEEYIENQNSGKTSFQLNIADSIDFQKVTNEIKINFFRIIQEAINNIHKHSEATKVIVDVQKEKSSILLKIWDNGKGFRYEESRKGIGLKNMMTRTKNIKGRISFQNLDDGMQITVYLKHSESYDR